MRSQAIANTLWKAARAEAKARLSTLIARPLFHGASRTFTRAASYAHGHVQTHNQYPQATRGVEPASECVCGVMAVRTASHSASIVERPFRHSWRFSLNVATCHLKKQFSAYILKCSTECVK